MVGWYKGKNGKWWSPEVRTKVGQEMRKLMKEGKFNPEMKCNKCGQTEGTIHIHNHDYSHPTRYVEVLCWRCHMMNHVEYKFPKEVQAYYDEVQAGKMYPPVYKHNMSILREHGIKLEYRK